MGTEEVLREILNVWIEKYPDVKILTDGQVYGLLNDYGNDANYIMSAIFAMPKIKSDGHKISFSTLQQYCRNNWTSGKRGKKPESEYEIAYERDKYGNLTAWGQHHKIMNTEWHIPVIEEYDPRNPKHLEIQFDHLFQSGQIGEEEYRLGMLGIKIMSGEVDLEDKLHFNKDAVEQDAEIPF